MAIKGRSQEAILKRLTEEIGKAGLDAVILTSAGSVFYATGFAVRSLYRSGKTGNAAAVVTAGGDVYLIFKQDIPYGGSIYSAKGRGSKSRR